MNSEFTSYIPESCTNISDFGIYTNRGITDSFTEMRFFVLESQLSILNEYSSQEIITESMKDKLKEIGAKIKKGFLDMLKATKEFFAKIFRFIKSLFSKMKQEVFSKATKTDFDNAVEFFDNYKKDVIKFTKESDDNIFFGTKEFVESADKYNKEILNRSKSAFDTLNDFYNKAGASTKIGIWLGKQIHDKKEAIKELNKSKSKQIFGYILFNKEYDNGLSDSFGKEEIQSAIYDNLNKVSFLRNPIDSSNLKNFSNKISEAVYSNQIQNKWVGITKNEYDNLKKIIDEAVKNADKYTFYTDDIESDFVSDMNKNPNTKDAFGPKYALDYAARCKDIITVLTSVSSVMNNLINDIYIKDIKLVCNIINKYYKLSHQKKEVIYDGVDRTEVDRANINRVNLNPAPA